MEKNVFVIDGANKSLIVSMFKKEGWSISQHIEQSDLVQFCGGEDVSPSLYKHHEHNTTNSSLPRDYREIKLFDQAMELQIPCVGICRGGQFLHVMNDGVLYQDVDNHCSPHLARTYSGIELVVSSTHHQMMRKSFWEKIGHISLLVASKSTTKKRMSPVNSTKYEVVNRNWYEHDDLEAVYYPETNSLSFQPHPEFNELKYKDCRNLYFSFINSYLFNKGE